MAANYVVETFEDYSEASETLRSDMSDAYGAVPHAGPIFIATFMLEKNFHVTPNQLFTDFCKAETSKNPEPPGLRPFTRQTGIHFYFLIMDYEFSNDPELLPTDYSANPSQIHIVYDTLPRGGLKGKISPLKYFSAAAPPARFALPRSIACHHQKFILLHQDDASLWCSGWNLTDIYWDEPDHPSHGIPPMNTIKHWQPWHDTAMRLHSLDADPDHVIADFEKEFVRRWNAAGKAAVKAAGKAVGKVAGKATRQLSHNFVEIPTTQSFFSQSFSPPYAATTAPPGAVRFSPRLVHDVQSLIQPELSQNGSKIEAWYEDKLAQASCFVYLENQYLSDDYIVDALIDNYLEHEVSGHKLHAAINLCSSKIADPGYLYADENMLSAIRIRLSTAEELTLESGLTSLTIKRPKGGWSSVDWAPGISHSHLPTRIWILREPGNLHRFYEDELVEAIGGVLMWTMVTWDRNEQAFKDVYIHSKQGIIDSCYTIGSGNIDDLSFTLNSEANVAINDGEAAYGLATKSWTNLLSGATPTGLMKLTTPADYVILPKTTPPGSAPLYYNIAKWYKALGRSARTNYQILKGKKTARNPKGLLVEFPYPRD